MDLERIVDAPPLVVMGRDARQAAYLLAWLRMEATGEWRAIVTYIHQVAERPSERKLVDVSGSSVRPLGPPAAYQNVPRLGPVPWIR